MKGTVHDGNWQITDFGKHYHADPASAGGQGHVRLRDDRDARGEVEQCIHAKGRNALPAAAFSRGEKLPDLVWERSQRKDTQILQHHKGRQKISQIKERRVAGVSDGRCERARHGVKILSAQAGRCKLRRDQNGRIYTKWSIWKKCQYWIMQ